METKKYVARFLVLKVGSFVMKERVLCLGDRGFSTIDPDSHMLTNAWTYDDVEAAIPLEGGTDFVVQTPRHRIRKTVFRCQYRMDVLVWLLRLRNLYRAKLSDQPRPIELDTFSFAATKVHMRGLESHCTIDVGPHGVDQRDEEGELMCHIGCADFVSIDLIADQPDAIQLNHSDNSSLFLVAKREEMAQAIHRVMRLYGIEINEHREKQLEVAYTQDRLEDGNVLSCQFPVIRISAANKPLPSRTLSISEAFVSEAIEDRLIVSRPLTRIFALIMFEDAAEALEIEFSDGVRRMYFTEQRERIVCELLASCHALGNVHVSVMVARTADAVRMVPRRTIRLGASNQSLKPDDASGIDRELRVAQGSVVQQIASRGASKTARMQRQFKKGLDEEMHSLALEFNANTSTDGVIAQPSKPFDRAVFFIAREIRDIVSRHGPSHTFLTTYLQSVYRLIKAPTALKEFVGILVEDTDGYLSKVSEMLLGRNALVVYWMLMVLHRMMESRSHRAQLRQVLLSKPKFASNLLTLFEMDSESRRYLSDLPTMKLCQFVLCLVKTNVDAQEALSNSLDDLLARKYRMVHRILFSYPSLTTVEACAGILSRMTNNPSSIFLDGDHVDASLQSRVTQAPPLSLSFGERMHYDAQNRIDSVSGRHNYAHKRSYRMAHPRSSSSLASSSGSVASGNGVAVMNPEVLLRQYRVLLEAQCGSHERSLDQYSESISLRLRYRFRNVFLQELMNHLVGSFEEFKRVFDVPCFHFSGFLGKTSGQREKSDIYLSPRALIAVRVMNRYTHEFEYRRIEQVNVPANLREAFSVTVNGKLRYVYSDQSTVIVQKMRELAGVVGVRLKVVQVEQLPKQGLTTKTSKRWSASLRRSSLLEVHKRGGRHGFTRLRRKQLLVANGIICEVDPESGKELMFSLRELRRIIVPHQEHDEVDSLVALEFMDGSRVAYVAEGGVACVLGKLFDGCRQVDNHWLTISPAFSRVNPRLSVRDLLTEEEERSFFMGKTGMYALSHAELMKDLNKLQGGNGTITSAMDKMIFALESLNMNVNEEDLATSTRGPVGIDFSPVFEGIVSLLEHASKAPMRVAEIAIILDAFCRINDGCFAFAMDQGGTVLSFVAILLRILEGNDPIATVWAVRAIESLVVEKSGLPEGNAEEKKARASLFANDKITKALVAILDRDHQLCALVVLQLLLNLLCRSRANTDNNHFDAIIKQLTKKSGMLLRMADQTNVVGLAVAATSLLKVMIDNGDFKTRQKICDQALEKGLTMQHLYSSFFHESEVGRETFRCITSMWTTYHHPSYELLHRMLPHGFIRMISNPTTKKLVQLDGEHFRQRTSTLDHANEESVDDTEWFVRRMRQEIVSWPDSSLMLVNVKCDATQLNYPDESVWDLGILAGLIDRDFELPDLVWNARMRKELKLAMEKCIAQIVDRNSAPPLSSMSSAGGAAHSLMVWNHMQFEVNYSANAELEVEHYYLRVLLSQIRDGSLRLEDTLKAVNLDAATLKTMFGDNAHMLLSAADLAMVPVHYFNEVYQRWLEELLLRNKSASVDGSLRLSLTEAVDANEDASMLVKVLVELAKAFPNVRFLSPNRVRFLVETVARSFSPHEAQCVVELLAAMSSSDSAARYLATEQVVDRFVHMATLCHRHSISRLIGATNDDFALMELQTPSAPESIGSAPVTHLSGAVSRLDLRWMVRIGDDDACGPYSVIELKEFLNAKVIDPSQLQSVEACCCSVHKKHESDRHEWHLLHQLPQLRWVEVMDDVVNEAALGIKSLQVLRNVVVNEPSSVINGVCVVPLPTGKRLVSSNTRLALVTQLLLVDNAEVRRFASEMLVALGPVVGRHLHRFGLFFFIFAADLDKVKASDAFVEEAKLLKQFHRIQDCAEVRPGQSFLSGTLPEPLISLLDTESPEKFAAVFTGRQSDKRVMWTSSMRNHLRDMILEHIDEFKEDLSRDVAAIYQYVSLPPVRYMELSRDVYVSGFFLSTIADIQGDIQAELEGIEEPLVLMSAIEEKWKYLVNRQTTKLAIVEEDSHKSLKVFGWDRGKKYTMVDLRAKYRDLCKSGMEITTIRVAYEGLCSILERKREFEIGRASDKVVRCILQAQQRLLDQFSFQFFSFESKTLHLILDLIASAPVSKESRLDGDDLRTLGVQTLHKLVSVAPLNIEKLLDLDSAWDVLLDMVEACVRSGGISTKESAFSILQMVVSSELGPMSLISSEPLPPTRQPSLMRLTSDPDTQLFGSELYSTIPQVKETPQLKRLCSFLDSLLTGSGNRQPWQIQRLLYGIVSSLCGSPQVQNMLVLSTKIFWKALYMLLSTAEDAAKTAVSVADGPDSVGRKERDVMESAFGALKVMSLGMNGVSHSQALDALANLLPLTFLDCLDRESGHDFWTVLASDIREPSCIWNEATRNELMQLVSDHSKDTSGDELSFLESAASYMYDCLKCEPCVGGIYLQVLLEKAGEDQPEITEESLFPTNALTFAEELFVFLNENRDPALGIYADTLPALECVTVLLDFPVFQRGILEALEMHADDEDGENAPVTVATLGRYLLPYDRNDLKGGVSISSRRSLSTYGFMSKDGTPLELDGLPEGMDAEFGSIDYLSRQEYALLILNKICGFECNLEKVLAPFRRFTWSLQAVADHLDYEQAYYALSCLAELCDTCLVVAHYVEQSGLWVEILGIAIQSRQYVLHEHFLRAEALREPAFEVLYALLVKDFTIRERMYSGLCRFLPYPMVYQIHLDPSKASRFFDDDHDKSDLIWNSQWRTEVRRKLDQVICRNRIERTKAKRDSVVLRDSDCVEMPSNFIGGLYLDHFLSRPDPENLTNPAYNLELLFQQWKEKLNCLMSCDLERPPAYLKEIADKVESLTRAMLYILRSPMEMDESIEAFLMPFEVTRFVRQCNKHGIVGFPYRCVLKLARHLVQFPELRSRSFLELLFCRMTVYHVDVPAIIKLVRRILDTRAGVNETEEAQDDSYVLKNLSFYSEVVAFLEAYAADKGHSDPTVLSNVNRILRVFKAEERADIPPIAQTFFQRASSRWYNFALADPGAAPPDSSAATTKASTDTAMASADLGAQPSPTSVKTTKAAIKAKARKKTSKTTTESKRAAPSLPISPVLPVVTEQDHPDPEDAEQERRLGDGTFDVDEERAADAVVQSLQRPPSLKHLPSLQHSPSMQQPPSSLIFDGEQIKPVAAAPPSFRFVNGDDEENDFMPPPIRASVIRAGFEPVDCNYHSHKAAEYEELDISVRASFTSAAGMPMTGTEIEVSASTIRRMSPPPLINITQPARRPSMASMASMASSRPSMASMRPSDLENTRQSSFFGSCTNPAAASQLNPLLTSMTISRRGRRAAAVYSRRKTQAPKRWFG